MSKKTMLLALAVVSAAVFALPAAASAQEAHMEGWTSFTGTAGAGSYATTGEPTFTFESVDINSGVVSAGGTTGSMSFDMTGCHATVFGFTTKCHTAGSPLDNTVQTKATFHVITVNNKPGILLTPETEEIITGGISNTHVQGNGLIGTITSPACGVESKTMTVAFSATGSTQNHLEYTGVKYDLKAKTSGGSQLTTGVTQTWTITFLALGKINCT